MKNLFEALPDATNAEIVEDLLKGEGIRIERIVSQGQRSPESGWYDQEENEWVIVLKGSGRIEYEDGGEDLLEEGDYVNIPRHRKHRVAWTDPDKPTVWLAVFYK